MLAGFLMIVGIGLLGMVTGSIATYFVGRLSREEVDLEGKKTVVDDQLEYIKGKLDGLQDLDKEHIKTLNEMIYGIWKAKNNKSKEVSN